MNAVKQLQDDDRVAMEIFSDLLVSTLLVILLVLFIYLCQVSEAE